MRNVVLWLALLVAAAGIVWLLQGINVLPGSFMTGDPFWATVEITDCLPLVQRTTEVARTRWIPHTATSQ